MLGDQWLRERRSAVLKVPSTVIESDFNYLLNPHHPQFGSIRIGPPQLYQFDLRLLR
jgi:RES domain-containing protein